MPNRKQIIIFSVLGIAALLIGYFKNPLNLSMGKRAEVQGPIAPTSVTNVITNLANNVVTNVITNAVPVQPQPNPAKPKAIPTRILTSEEKKLVGAYEVKLGGSTQRMVLLANGIREFYVNGKDQNSDSSITNRNEPSWSVVNNELHINRPNSHVEIYRINPDNSVIGIAYIRDGKRIVIPKEQQIPIKKINQPEPARTLTLEEKNIVGTYEQKAGNAVKYIFRDDGIREQYVAGKKSREDKWSIVGNEVHVIGHISVSIIRINPDNSITHISYIMKGGKRTDRPKERQHTFIKIK